MKLTKAVIATFEEDQKELGTKVALWNLLWRNATLQLSDLGIKTVRTE